MPSTKSHCLFCFSLLLWLSAWIALSWGAVQDDAFIHFRYANNLALRSFVTYDGVHPNYGSSSLLYIGILALFRRLTDSPQLPRVVSSAVHLLLFGGLAIALGRYAPRRAGTARLAGAVLLALLVTPSAVRWLDDGMETGLVVSVALAMAWMVHAAAYRSEASRFRSDALLGVVAFLAVMLRTELLLLCGVGFSILLWERVFSMSSAAIGRRSVACVSRDAAARDFAQENTLKGAARVAIEDWAVVGVRGSLRPVIAIVLGAAVAAGMILAMMHVLLPDTAIAKSHGIAHWLNPIHDTAVTLAGAFSFGAGMLAFWLLTLALVARHMRLTPEILLANCLFPVILGLSSLRGQEIQGVRYFAWTFAFSILWNILELASVVPPREAASSVRAHRRGAALLYAFAGLLAVELPVESVAMHRLLRSRGETTRVFVSQHLEVLRSRRGVASDIGFIGYFSGAQICDLAGLVNGRTAARLSSKERIAACAETQPEFMFLSGSQFGAMAAVTGVDDWKVCGEYDFANVRTVDRHYLLVRPGIAAEVCQATSRQQESVAAIFATEPNLVAERRGE